MMTNIRISREPGDIHMRPKGKDVKRKQKVTQTKDSLVFQMFICQKNMMSEEQGHFLELYLKKKQKKNMNMHLIYIYIYIYLYSALHQCTTYLRSNGISD